MKLIILFIGFSILGSCCPKYPAILQAEPVISEKEVIFLAKNCDYLELMCSEKMIKTGNDKEYIYDYKIVTLLNKTDCFEGKPYSKLLSVIGDPSISTDLIVGYRFVKQNEPNKFVILNFGLRKGVVHGSAILSGYEVKN